jgi:hypothetical protein
VTPEGTSFLFSYENTANFPAVRCYRHSWKGEIGAREKRIKVRLSMNTLLLTCLWLFISQSVYRVFDAFMVIVMVKYTERLKRNFRIAFDRNGETVNRYFRL